MWDNVLTHLVTLVTDKYGPTFVYGGFLGQNRLYVTDPKALAHILVHRAVRDYAISHYKTAPKTHEADVPCPHCCF